MVAQLHIVAEPLWLEEMNELEHLVLHVAFVMAGFIAGASGFAGFFWSVLKLLRPRRRRRIIPEHEPDPSGRRLKQGHLIAVSSTALVAITAMLLAQHGWIAEPAWLANITPFQHFVAHVGYVVGGAVAGVCGLGAFLRSLLELLERDRVAVRSSYRRSTQS